MDKELLRIVIIATGLLVIVGMLVWAFIKGKHSRRGSGYYDDGEIVGNIDKSLVVNTENDDFDIVPLGPARETVNLRELGGTEDNYDDPSEWADEEPSLDMDEEEPPPRFVAPEIIQFSVVARAEEGFNGNDLASAFQLAGLEYGPLKIFERLDADRSVHFRVANMVSPGTFPANHLDAFYCPGIVCFMQPGEQSDAASVFEDYLETIDLLAAELGGDILDHQRNPLSDTTVQLIRQ
ncbi:MAG: cell division protein ZipA C-terminal FtsZ-binding domain-containing protein, partial [Gammaproteobacteria bacterium]